MNVFRLAIQGSSGVIQKNVLTILIILASASLFWVSSISPLYLLLMFSGLVATSLYLIKPELFLFFHCSYWLLHHLSQQYVIGFSGMNVYLTDVLLAMGILYLFITYLKPHKKLYPTLISKPLLAFILLGFLQLILGMLLSGNEIRHSLRDTAAVSGYLMVFVAYTVFSSRKAVNRWVKILLLIGSLTATYAIIMRVMGIQALGFEGSERVGTSLGYVSRAYGLAGATPFIFISFFLCFSMLIQRTQPKHLSFWYRMATIVSLVQLLLLFGRSVFVGLIGGLMVVGITLRKRTRGKFLAVVALAGLLLFIVAPSLEVPLSDELSDRYLSIIDREAGGLSAQSNIEWRQRELQGIWEALDPLERITGKGLGSRIMVSLFTGVDVEGYHNSFAEILLKMGLIGMLVYAWFIICMMIEMRRTYAIPILSRYKSIYIGCIAAFISILIWGFGTGGMPLNASIPAAIGLGLGLSARQLLIRNKETNDFSQ